MEYLVRTMSSLADFSQTLAFRRKCGSADWRQTAASRLLRWNLGLQTPQGLANWH